jgi:lipopolysaccharide export system permease protein
MRSHRTLSRYVLREVSLTFLLGLAAIGIVLVSRNLLRFLDEVIAAGFRPSDLARVVGYLAAILAPYAVPIAFLFAALVTVGRLAADAEIVAMRACGLGLSAIAVPVLAFGAVASALTFALVLEVEHRAQRDLRMLVKSLAARGVMVQPGRFNTVDERIFFARSRAPDGFRGVLISDRSDPGHPFTIFAEAGSLEIDPALGALVFRLERGDIDVDPDGGPEHRISFESFDYRFEAASLLGSEFSRLRPREMTMGELRAVLARAEAGESLDDLRRKEPVHYQLHLHRRLALPLSPVLFALVAVPLGASRVRGARAWGALLCALLAVAYYALLTAGQGLALRGDIPPAVALWIPNACFAATGGALFVRARRHS